MSRDPLRVAAACGLIGTERAEVSGSASSLDLASRGCE